MNQRRPSQWGLHPSVHDVIQLWKPLGTVNVQNSSAYSAVWHFAETMLTTVHQPLLPQDGAQILSRRVPGSDQKSPRPLWPTVAPCPLAKWWVCLLLLIRKASFANFFEKVTSLKGYSVVIKLYFMYRHTHQNRYMCGCICRFVFAQWSVCAREVHVYCCEPAAHCSCAWGLSLKSAFSYSCFTLTKEGGWREEKEWEGIENHLSETFTPLHPHLHTVLRVHIYSIYTYTPGANITMTFGE